MCGEMMRAEVTPLQMWWTEWSYTTPTYPYASVCVALSVMCA